MELLRDDDADYLVSLEERILKAVDTVSVLRKENAALKQQLSDAHANNSDAESLIASLRKELEGLRSERKQVRGRIEKLLGQIDTLSAG